MPDNELTAIRKELKGDVETLAIRIDARVDSLFSKLDDRDKTLYEKIDHVLQCQLIDATERTRISGRVEMNSDRVKTLSRSVDRQDGEMKDIRGDIKRHDANFNKIQGIIIALSVLLTFGQLMALGVYFYKLAPLAKAITP